MFGRLLAVLVSDREKSVRHSLLGKLLKTEEFDCVLCQGHHLSTLLLLTGDIDFDIRLDALTLLGRLAEYNPAYVLPEIRNVFISSILTQLKFSRESGQK